jgi:hypothetical protein
MMMERTTMPSKTKESGRVDFLLRMEPELKARITKAANHHRVSVNDWLLDGIEDLLAFHDAEVTADKKKADLEQRLEMKFAELVETLAGAARLGDVTLSKADAQIELEEQATAAITKWRDHMATFHHAEPRRPLERLCRDYCDIEDEIDGGAVKGIDTSFEIQIDDTDPDDDEFDDACDDGE